MNIAVIGATGLVGRVLLDVLEHKQWVCSVSLLSKNACGKYVEWRGQTIPVLQDCDWSKIDVTFIATPENVGKDCAELSNKSRLIVDKSGAMRGVTPLIIPEVNGDLLSADDHIVSSPNCVVIPLATVISRLLEIGISLAFVSTYQSVSGAGKSALDALENGSGFTGVYPCIGSVDSDGISSEEEKIKSETARILAMQNSFDIVITSVRVPVKVGHGISLTCVFSRETNKDEIIQLITSIKCISYCEDAASNLSDIEGKDNIVISRLRGNENTWSMWIASDNLRRGAAVNSVDIVEYMRNKHILS